MVVVLGFLMLTVVTRYAGVEVYGKIVILTALSGLVSNLLTFRTNEAVTKFYKIGLIEGNRARCTAALLIGLIVDIAMGCLCVVLINIFSNDIADSLLKQPGAGSLVSIYAWVTFLGFVRGSAFGLLLAEERFALVNLVAVIEHLVKLLIVVGILIVTSKLDFEWIIWATLWSCLLVSIAMVSFLFVRWWPVFAFDRTVLTYLREYLSFSGSTFLSSSLKAGNQSIDTIMFGVFSGPISVGIYGILKQFLSPMVIIGGPFSAQSFPRFVSAAATNNFDFILNSIEKVNRMLLIGTAVIFVLSAAILVPYANWNQLGFSYAHYISFFILAIANVLNQQMWWARPFSLSFVPRASVVGNLIATALLILLLPFLITSFDVVGGAVAMFLTQLILLLYWKGKLRSVFRAG